MKQPLLTSPRFIRKYATLLVTSLVVLTAFLPTNPTHAESLISAKTYKKVGTLSISILNVTSPIYMGITDEVFNQGVGQWPGSAKPGKAGNVVLGAHRTSRPRPFSNIDKLRGGDIISISVGAKTHKYIVTGHSVVKPTSLWITNPTRGATLTLFSCHPKGSVKSRYVIRAVLAS